MKKHNEQIISKDGYLQTFSMQREIYEECHVEIILYRPNNKQQKIFFRDVRDMKIGRLDNLCVPLITVSDVSSYQWENIKYRVYDDENDLFSFYCRGYTVEGSN